MSSGLKYFFTILFIGVAVGGCSGLEESEKEKIRQRNAVAEPIHRNHDEYSYQVAPERHRVRAPYPWEEKK